MDRHEKNGFLITKYYAVNYDFIQHVYRECHMDYSTIFITLKNGGTFELLKAPSLYDESFVLYHIARLVKAIELNETINFTREIERAEELVNKSLD